jgi:hypothetical protein
VREQATPSWSDKICNEEVKKTDYIAESLLQLYLVEKGSVTFRLWEFKGHVSRGSHWTSHTIADITV